MSKHRNHFLVILLLVVALTVFDICCIFIGIKTVRSIAVRNHQTEKTETVDPSDKVYIVADYDRKIFGPYRFNRGSSEGQFIYEQTDSDIDSKSVLVGGGKIEKYLHDGSRFIAYHYTERICTKVEDSEIPIADGDQYYAILDTQEKTIEKFTDIEALSKAVQKRDLSFGNWFYTAAGNSIEGIRTELLGDYTCEYLNEARGQSILLREIPLFYGVLQNVCTDGERYIAFRQRIINDELRPWYNDPITNTLLHAPSETRIGLYRRGLLDWYSVFYDQYVLFDTQDHSVREFEKERELKAFCESKDICLQTVEIRKNT